MKSILKWSLLILPAIVLYPDYAFSCGGVSFYALPLLVFPLMIALETLIFRLMEQKQRHITKSLLLLPVAVLLANLVSAFLGILFLKGVFLLEILEGSIVLMIFLHFFLTAYIECEVYVSFFRDVKRAYLLKASLLMNFLSHPMAIFVLILAPAILPGPKKPVYSIALVNLEMVRSSLSQYAADREDECYPPNEAIRGYSDLESTLAQYGLTLPQQPAGVKWHAFTSYTRDEMDCTLYTVTVEVADKSKTVIKATPRGSCCDDTAPSAKECDDHMKNIPKCGTDFGLF